MLPSVASDTLPHLVRALKALGAHPELREDALDLADELAGITVMVAERFTNDRTAEGLQEAYKLTIGCVSLGLAQELSDAQDGEEAMDLLLEHGAEHAFQVGFRQIREVDKLPADAMLFEFERDESQQQARQKILFKKICLADPNVPWHGHLALAAERTQRQSNYAIVECARWLRRHHYEGPVHHADLDAEGIIAVAIIFAIDGSGRIVAKASQKDFEDLIRRVRDSNPDFEAAWGQWIKKIPHPHRDLIEARIAAYRENKNSLFKKIAGKSNLATLFKEFQKYAGDALEVEYD